MYYAGGAGRHRAEAADALREPERRASAARGLRADHAPPAHRDFRRENGTCPTTMNKNNYCLKSVLWNLW